MAALTEIFDKPRIADTKRGDTLLPKAKAPAERPTEPKKPSNDRRNER